MNRTSIASLLTVVLALPALAGPINPPPGPIVSTHKTLTEVEPRIAVNATNTPGDSFSSFRITQPGSYFLTGNITGVAGKHGIVIAAEGVTLDLMGYSLLGVSGSLDGIRLDFDLAKGGATIVNGTVQGWGGDGIDVSWSDSPNGPGGRIEGVRSRANGGSGIRVSDGGVVVNCFAGQNGLHGFDPGNNAAFENCIAQGNTGDGFSSGFGCTFAHCEARANIGRGYLTTAGSFVNCSATNNGGSGFELSTSTVNACHSSSNVGVGYALSSCLVQSSSAHANGAGGIQTSSRSVIRENRTESGPFGIKATGSDNRLEGNNCVVADRGIDVDASGNIIVRNTCSGNTVNWDIVANNVVGPILDRTSPASLPIIGNSAPSSLGTTDPNANFTY